MMRNHLRVLAVLTTLVELVAAGPATATPAGARPTSSLDENGVHVQIDRVALTDGRTSSLVTVTLTCSEPVGADALALILSQRRATYEGSQNYDVVCPPGGATYTVSLPTGTGTLRPGLASLTVVYGTAECPKEAPCPPDLVHGTLDVRIHPR